MGERRRSSSAVREARWNPHPLLPRALRPRTPLQLATWTPLSRANTCPVCSVCTNSVFLYVPICYRLTVIIVDTDFFSQQAFIKLTQKHQKEMDLLIKRHEKVQRVSFRNSVDPFPGWCRVFVRVMCRRRRNEASHNFTPDIRPSSFAVLSCECPILVPLVAL